MREVHKVSAIVTMMFYRCTQIYNIKHISCITYLHVLACQFWKTRHQLYTRPLLFNSGIAVVKMVQPSPWVRAVISWVNMRSAFFHTRQRVILLTALLKLHALNKCQDKQHRNMSKTELPHRHLYKRIRTVTMIWQTTYNAIKMR